VTFCFVIRLWGLYVFLILSSMPYNLKSSCQKLLIKVEFGSLAMDTSILCNLTTSLMQIPIIYLAAKRCLRAMKWAYLLNLSTTNRIVSNPLSLGSLVMKSILILSQIVFKMVKVAWYFLCWHTWQLATNWVIVPFTPLQFNDWASILYVLYLHKCSPIVVQLILPYSWWFVQSFLNGVLLCKKKLDALEECYRKIVV